MRLIDADERIEKIDIEREILVKDGRLGAEHILVHYVREFIEDAPTVDRAQGEWKHLEEDEWVCSNCGYVVWTEGSWEHPLERGKDFCEHCGARM